jgi:Zn finger protein HypA/HybF involved in hydrogenase expression
MPVQAGQSQAGQHQYKCPSCGASLEFAPGTAAMVCPYCQARLDIALPESGSAKHDYVAYAGQPHTPVAQLPAFSLSCDNCGSSQQQSAIAARCPSCRSALVVSNDLDGQLKSPDGVLPLIVDKARAAICFQEWTSSRWFAPSALKKVSKTASMNGSYLPHWGFDDRTTTDYTGQRGDHYYTTETYTTQENGQTVTNTRQVQHTRWSHASGRVARDFVDVLATGVSTPDAGLLEKLGPWTTADATGYQPEYLAGFDSPRYDIDAEAGFVSARQDMASVIHDDCRADIGGDEQRVSQMSTTDQDVLFRLLLLPLWIATYIAGGKTFDVFVNANTGEVIGERPYSAVKIAAAVVAAVAAVTAAYLLYLANAK